MVPDPVSQLPYAASPRYEQCIGSSQDRTEQVQQADRYWERARHTGAGNAREGSSLHQFLLTSKMAASVVVAIAKRTPIVCRR